ncbi:MAG: aminodeoxychorismate synthase, component I [Gammaproteobacteria bacterium]|nr:MAG: aminodeoxychorismate synthase, component I [Gammaproteobacteria bacterium]
MTKLTQSLQNTRPFILFENTDADTLKQALAAIDEERKKGHYLAGYISYEAGYALSEKLSGYLPEKNNGGQALLRFYAFDRVQKTTAQEVTKALAELPESPPYIKHWQPTESETEYVEKLSKIHDYIAAGDTYQVNHTYRVNFELAGSIHGLYAALRVRQPVPFSALMHLPDCSVLSLSPELFVKKQGTSLMTRPMKGTAARGKTDKDDRAILKAMAEDKKQQSENLMIVDLMRNDIGRLAKTGTMKVSKLFEIQTYKTLHQMISTIGGEVDPDISFTAVVEGLFPCGSITGAPKIRTMEIIHELENTPRNIYTGAIGFITPGNDFSFNVPIRTLTFPNSASKGSLGIGGGIIYESDASDEWRESKLKAQFLTGLNEQFQLIESFLYKASTDHIPRFGLHLERLTNSADFFGIPLVVAEVKDAVMNHIAVLKQAHDHQNSANNYKIRLLLNHVGECSVNSEVISENNPGNQNNLPKIALSNFRIEAGNLFRQHKTTNRKLYNDEFSKYAAQGFYDVLFLNEQGNIAEASSNLSPWK